jgi:hypothetical protein
VTCFGAVAFIAIVKEEPSPIYYEYYDFQKENLILFTFSLTKKNEADPLSPPVGEAAQGVYPLDPLLAI